MGVELGRISGPLLANNLVRNGIDLAFETQLLYFDVSSQQIGINTVTPGRLFDIDGTTTSTNLIVDTELTVPNFSFSTNVIQNLVNTIYFRPDQTTNPRISAPSFSTDNINISDQLIKNFVNGDDIELSPNGSGIVQFNSSKVNVNGSLHATGDITWDGSITFGDNDLDSVDFNADITSNITPDVASTYDLGADLKRWNNLYTDTVTATNIVLDTLTINNINLLSTAGNTLYVSKNGLDTNYGDHAHSTFATIKQALDSAASGDTIVIFPGTYEEEFPLTVPSGVGIRGSGIRATTIKPTLATNNKDAFLISGDTMLEFFTVSDFYFDSVNNTGYAFRFANGFKTTGRSPYFHNITVKTQGSVTNPTDLRGFASGDAGAGGYFDGSVADPTSNVIPTALFFSVTFITPNADSLTLMNGVRCEWLNSFTYFAKRGTYLVNGTAGRYNQGTVFGAELRAINSANVYGTYGAVADGPDTLAYLIGHNFGYIGTDGDYTNDPTLAIQANEILQVNDGVIYFETTDHLGDIRVGDIFYVSQATGIIAFDAQSINIGAGGNITIEGPNSTTIINELGYQTGNIRVYGNTISSLVGPVNFLANAGANTTYVNTNVEITGSLGISSDLTADSSVYFGSDALDTITINAYLTQDINPIASNSLYLGSDSFRWSRLNSNVLDVNGVTQITSNKISTLSGNTDLKLQANNTGRIHAATNNVQIDNDLTIIGTTTVNGATSLKNTVIRTPVLTPTTTVSAMNYNANGTSAYFFRVYGPSHPSEGYERIQPGWTCVQIPGAVVVSNVPDPGDNNESCVITITGGTFVLNTFYSFTGNVTSYSPNTLTLAGNLNQTGNTYITGTFGNNNIQITGNSYFQVPNIRLYDNVISNQLLNQDLIFTANGTGAVRIEKLDFVDNIISNAWAGATTESQKNVILSPNGSGNTVINSTKALKLPIGSNTNRTMVLPGGIRYNNTYNRYEGYQPNGLVSFTNMYSYDTTSARYTTSSSKTTLGVTSVSINVGEYTVQVSSTAGLSVGYKVVSGPSVTPGTRITSIDGNILTFDLPTTNSIAGVIIFGPVTLNFALISGLQIGQSVSGTNIQVGTTITGWNSTSITLSLPISGNILVGSSITFGPINSTYITPELTPGTGDNTLRFGINGQVRATLSSTAFATNTWNVGNINVSGSNIGQLTTADLYIAPDSGITTINNISIQDSEVTNNLNSEFLIQSTGQGYIKFAGKGAVVFPIGDDSQRRLNPVIGETRYNTDQSYLEVYNGEGWYPAIGTSGAASEEEIVEITNLWSLVLG